MFDKSEVPPDDPMFEHIDQINRSIARVRAFLKDRVTFGTLEDLPMIGSQWRYSSKLISVARWHF